MAVKFTTSKDTGNLEWYSHGGPPDLTTEEAQVVALADMANALEQIASGLHAIADAIADAERADD